MKSFRPQTKGEDLPDNMIEYLKNNVYLSEWARIE